MAADRISYQSGFGNTFSTEALKNALPVGRNSPQRPPKGLYPEVLSGTAFTAPRAENRSSWLYKLRPSAMHGPYKRAKDGLLRSGPFSEVETPPIYVMRHPAREVATMWPSRYVADQRVRVGR